MKKKLIGLLLTILLLLPTSSVYAATDADHKMKLLDTKDYTSATLVSSEYVHGDFTTTYLHQITLNKKNYLAYCLDEGYASPSGEDGKIDGSVVTSNNITTKGNVKLSKAQVETLKNILAASYQDTGKITTKSYSKANLRSILASQILVWEVMNNARPAGEYGSKSDDLKSNIDNNYKFVTSDSSLFSAYKSVLSTANKLAGNKKPKSFGQIYTMHWNDGSGQYEVTGINIDFYSVDEIDNPLSVSGKTSKDTISITTKVPLTEAKKVTFKYVKGSPITTSTKLKYFKFKEDEGARQRIILSNYQKKTTGDLTVKTESGNFQLAKLDAGNNQGLKGAVFNLYKCSSESSCDTTATATIDMKDKTVSDKININKSGLYKIVETTVPAGYEKVDDFFVTLTIKNNGQVTAKIDSSVRHVTQNAATSDTVLRLIVKNESKVFNIKKIDGVTNAEIKGAEFKIKKSDGTVVKFKQIADGSYQYDADGTITSLKTTNFSSYSISSLPVGEYVLEEVSVPNPYVLPTKQLERETKFKIDATQFLQVYNYTTKNYVKAYDLSITVKNFKTRVKIIKTGLKSARLPGVVFELYDSMNENSNHPIPLTIQNGIYVYSSSETPVQLTTNSNGEIIIDNLPEGSYYLKEVSTGDTGYAIDPNNIWTKIDIYVNRDNATPYNYTKEIRNAKGSFCFYKIDEDGNYLDKGEFKLQKYNEEKAVYEDVALIFNESDRTFSIDTTNSSDTYIFSPISGGQTCFVDVEAKSKYKVVELQAPEGFVLPSSSEAEAEIEINEHNYAVGDAVIMNRKVNVGGGAQAQAELVVNIQTGQNRIHYVVIISAIVAIIAALILLKKKIDKK